MFAFDQIEKCVYVKICTWYLFFWV